MKKIKLQIINEYIQFIFLVLLILGFARISVAGEYFVKNIKYII